MAVSLRRPGPGQTIALDGVMPCPLCREPAEAVRLEVGLQYVDPWFDTYRWGSWEELGPAERWETVMWCPEFDRIVVDPCGHVARGVRAVHWRAQLAAVTAEPTAVGLPARRGINLVKPFAVQLGANQPAARYRGAATVVIPAVPAWPVGAATVPLRVPDRPAV